MNSPEAIYQLMAANGEKKGRAPFKRLIILGLLAGAFIALGAMGASAGAHAFQSPGVQKLITALIFPAGLVMVLLCGAELFTGDCLAVIACFEGRLGWGAFARLLALAWLANFAGGLLIALLCSLTPQWQMNGGLLGAYTLKLAADKTALAFGPAFFSGILCNVLVCLSVWAAAASPRAEGKVICCYLPMLVFILGCFEHCVANMYYIPSGLLAKENPAYVALAQSALGMTAEKLANLTWGGFFLGSLLPVTLGNMVGGGLLVAGAYGLAYGGLNHLKR